MSRSRTNSSYVKSLNPKTIADESRGLIETLNSKVATAAAGAASPTNAQIALCHGSTGTALKPLAVDANGHLEVNFTDEGGLATETKQSDMIDLLQGETPALNRTKAIPVQIMVGDSGSNYDALRASGQDLMVMVDDMNPDVAVNSGLARSDKQDALNASLASVGTDEVRVEVTSGTVSVGDVRIKGNDGNDGAGTDRIMKTDANGVVQVGGTVTTSISDVVIKGNDGNDGSGTDRTIKTDGNGAVIVDPSKEGVVSADGTTTALHSMMLGNNSGNLRTIKCDANGVVSVDGSASTQPVSGVGTFAVSAASLPLPSGAATAAKQPALGTAGTASADVLSVQGIASMTPLVVDGSASTQPISASSLPLPTGAATSALQTTGNTSLATIAGDTTSIDGKITACNTGAVVVSSSALPAGASTAAKQPALGTAGTASADVLSVQGIASMTALVVDGSASTQPISASSLPLPSGAATSALQTTGNTSLATIAGDTTSIDGKITACNTGAVVISSSALPSGAASEATLSNAEAHLGTIDTSTAGIVASHYADGGAIGGSDTGVLIMGKDNSNNAHPVRITSAGDVEVEIADFVKGQAAKAASFPVVIASDQDTLAVEQTYTYGSEYTIINAQTIANGDTVTSSAFEIQSIKNTQAILNLSVSAGGSTNFDIAFEGSLNGSDFYQFPDSTIIATGDAIVSTEKADINLVRYMKVKITNQHGSGSHTFTLKGSVLGATLASA